MKSHENTDCRSVVCSYPITGFSNDVAKLLQRFVATKSIRFEEFNRVWKASNFTFIYLGRNGLREQRDLVEEAFRVMLKYIMPPYNMQVRVGGVYTLYSIYHTQPLKHKTKIRIPLSCWPNFCELEKEILEQKHLDAAYIIRKLKSDRAIQLCAYPSTLSVDEAYVSNNSQSAMSSATEYEESNSLSQLLEDDTIGQLDAVQEKYHQLKCSYNGTRNGESDSPATSLNLIKPDFARAILDIIKPPKSYQESGSKYSAKPVVDQSDSDSGERATRLKSIKRAALSSKVDDVRKCRRGRQSRPPRNSSNQKVAENGLVTRKRGRPTALPPSMKVSDSTASSDIASNSDSNVRQSSNCPLLHTSKLPKSEKDDEYKPIGMVFPTEGVRKQPSRSSRKRMKTDVNVES